MIQPIFKGPHTVHLQRQKKHSRAYAPRGDSGQPAHSHSVIRIFTGRFLDSHGFKTSLLSADREDWRECADAQANLSLLGRTCQNVPFTRYGCIHLFTFYHSVGLFSWRQIGDIFLIFPSKQYLTFHANCLRWRQFAWNVKSCFLGK